MQQDLNQLKALARQTLERQLQQPEMVTAMLQFLRQHQGKELEVTIEIRMEPKAANPS